MSIQVRIKLTPLDEETRKKVVEETATLLVNHLRSVKNQSAHDLKEDYREPGGLSQQS